MTFSSAIIWAWLGFSLLSMIPATLLFLWAYRSGCLSDQERARYLPLCIGMKDGAPSTELDSRKKDVARI